MSKLKHIRNAIYRLKQRVGLPIAYHVLDRHSVDPETGNKTDVLQVINIKKAIVLEARQYRSFVYDLAYISANKDFTTGGFFDPEDRQVIIEASDLLGNKPQIDDYIVFQNYRYDVAEIHEFENNYAYGLLCKKIRGQELTQIVTRLSGLILTDVVTFDVVDKLIRDVTSPLNLTQDLVENV